MSYWFKRAFSTLSLLVVLTTTLFPQTAFAVVPPSLTSAVIQSATSSSVVLYVTGANFSSFVSTVGYTADSTDLAKITYNSLHPSSAVIDETGGKHITVTFAIPSATTGKSGGSFTIDAGTIKNGGGSNAGQLSIANGSITDSTAPILAEVTPVPSSTDLTPDFTFSSTEAGTITYGGDCSSSTTAAVYGNNTVTFDTLSVGAHSNCTIVVTDSASNASSTLNLSSFTLTAADTTPPTLSTAWITAPNQILITFSEGIFLTTSSDYSNFGGALAGRSVTSQSDNGSGSDHIIMTLDGSAMARDAVGSLDISSSITDMAGNHFAGATNVTVGDAQSPYLSTSLWHDVDNSGTFSATDTYTLTFIEPMDTSTITDVNVDTRLGLSNGHTFGTTGNGMSTSWNGQGTILTVTLGSDNTLADGDTINPAWEVKDAHGNADDTVSDFTLTADTYYSEYWNYGEGTSPAFDFTPTPDLIRNDASLSALDWGGGSPDSVINADHFIARFTKTTYFNGGDYQFDIDSDDGIMITIDGGTLLSAWQDTYYGSLYPTISAGYHTIVVSFYENGGDAHVYLNYNLTLPHYEASDVLGHVYVEGAPDFTADCWNDCGDPSAATLAVPTTTALDPVDHRLFVADYGNNRVLMYNLDEDNNLLDHEADVVLGQEDMVSSTSGVSSAALNAPRALVYDSSHKRLFVGDTSNSRVLVFDANPVNFATGMAASYVLGQADFDTNTYPALSSSSIAWPFGMAYDAVHDRLFVADGDGNDSRVLVFDTRLEESGASDLCGFTSYGIVNNMAASCVLGYADFTSGGYSTSQNSFHRLADLAYDPDQEVLYVTDMFNNRVLVFDARTTGSDPRELCGDSEEGLSNGMNASCVIGQPDFESSDALTSQNGLWRPKGLSFDPVNNQLFVAEIHNDYGDGNDRVVVFDTSSLSNQPDAVGVIGHGDFETSDYNGASQVNFQSPHGVLYDPVRDRLYVADTWADRILIFDMVHIDDTALTDGADGLPYEYQLTTSGSQGTVSFSLVDGSLPDGLELSSSGVVSGTPTTPGLSTFTVRATDTFGVSTFVSQKQLTLQIGNRRTLYFDADFDNDWSNLANWWDDESFTDPADSLPSSIDDVVISGNLSSNSGDPAEVNDLTYLEGTNAIELTVNGRASFYGTSGNTGGTINGDVDFYDMTANGVGGPEYFPESGTINGNVTFSATTANYGTINGNVTFSGEFGNAGLINGDVIFNDHTSNPGAIVGEVTFNDTSWNDGNWSAGGLITGHVTFNDDSFNSGSIEGNVDVYYPAQHPLGGSVTGTITYHGYGIDIYVDDDYTSEGVNDGHTWGLDAFDNLADGIAAAEEYSTVHVAGGTYTSSNDLVIDYPMFIDGPGIESEDPAVVTNNSCDYVFSIYASNTTLQGLQIRQFNGEEGYCRGYPAIRVRGGHNEASITDVTITENDIGGGYRGILLRGDSSENTVSNNTIHDASYGITLASSKDNSIHDNSIHDNGTGIYFWDGDCGMACDGNPSGNTVEDNDIYSNSDYGIYARYGDDNLIQNNEIYDNGASQWDGSGIYFSGNGLEDNSISSNIIYDNYTYGIALYINSIEEGHGNLIDLNSIYNNGFESENVYASGIYASASYTNITHNSIAHNRLSGIQVPNDENSVDFVTITYNTIGSAIIGEDEYAGNTNYGLYIGLGEGHQVHNNQFQDNGIGIYNASGNEVAADLNYWGEEQGPYNPTNPGGQGDSINGEAAPFEDLSADATDTSATLSVSLTDGSSHVVYRPFYTNFAMDAVNEDENAQPVWEERGFEYGADTEYGSSVSESAESFELGLFSLTAEGLSCGTSYHFRAYAFSASLYYYSEDDTFSTQPCGSEEGGAFQEYRYIKWDITRVRGGGGCDVTCVQAGEFYLLNDGENVTWPEGTVASNPGGSNELTGDNEDESESPPKLVDDDESSKWLDNNFNETYSQDGESTLIIDTGEGHSVVFNGYRWVTANDMEDRDPVSWTLYGSDDGETWTLLDSRDDEMITTDRYASTRNFALNPEGDPAPEETQTVVVTGEAEDITRTTATVNGSVESIGTGESYFVEGVEYREEGSEEFTDTVDDFVVEGISSGDLSFNLENLTCGTTYEYRIFLEGESLYAYGDTESFTTNDCPVSAPESHSSGGGSGFSFAHHSSSSSSNSSSSTTSTGASDSSSTSSESSSGSSSSKPTPFTDTQNHWAKLYIDELQSTCGVLGYTDENGQLLHEFGPDDLSTRAELVKMVVACRFGDNLQAEDNLFSDVEASAWFAPYISRARKEGWISGYPDGTFRPNETISRTEALKIILLSQYAMEDITKMADSTSSSFTDVDMTQWYAPFVNFARSKALISGYVDANGNSTGLFGVFDPITRGAIAKVVVKTQAKRAQEVADALKAQAPALSKTPSFLERLKAFEW